MRIHCLSIIVIILTIFYDLGAQTIDHKGLNATYSQQFLYRFTLIEFKQDMTFDYHIMSERAHHHSTGSYILKRDTIILKSDNCNSEFDFNNYKWLKMSRNKILISNNKSDRKKQWSVLKKDKKYNYVPDRPSDLAIKIDSIKHYSLAWKKDTTNYDSELKLLIHDPLPPKDPVVIMDGLPVRYQFLLNYYFLSDIESITYKTGEDLINIGMHGGQAESGIIILTTIKNKPKR